MSSICNRVLKKNIVSNRAPKLDVDNNVTSPATEDFKSQTSLIVICENKLKRKKNMPTLQVPRYAPFTMAAWRASPERYRALATSCAVCAPNPHKELRIKQPSRAQQPLVVTRASQHLRSWVRLLVRENLSGFNDVVLSVVVDVSVDSEAPVVTSSILRSVACVFEDTHRDRVACGRSYG